MEDWPLRLGLLVAVLVPFFFMMASVYLAIHMAFARLIASPQSQVLWFFTVVTGPLTRPIRALLPAQTPERRVRAIALAVYVVLWLATDQITKALVPTLTG